MGSWAGIDEFLAVAQMRSFTQAAKRLGCSSSQVSRVIAALEDRLESRLFYRTTRSVGLTEVGERFLVSCRRLVEERDEALAAISEPGEDLHGQLRLTCAVTYGERFVVPIINDLMVENPRLEADVLLTDEVIDIVDAGIDLAVRFGNLRDSRLVATRLASRMRLLCASPGYLDRHGTPQTLADLVQHECIRGRSDAWTFASKGQPYLHRPQGRFRCNSGLAVLEAALQGLGLCRLPDFYVRRHLDRGELIELLPDFRPADEGVWAVYPDRRHLPTKVRVVVAQLHNRLGQPSG